MRVLVFARDPQPGRVKSRLVPALGEEGARDLYLLLLDHVLEQVHAADVGPVELWVDRVPANDLLASRTARFGPLPVRIQDGADLGLRMAHALETVLAEGELPLLAGSDLPGLTAAHCRDGAAALARGADAVYAPALDGGYGLVGLRAPWRDGFEDMPWGTTRVMAETRRRATTAGLDLAELESVWDVDEPGDLMHLDRVPSLAGWREALEHIR